MRFLSRAKDGGPKSTVTGYWLVELKDLFSVVLLKFEDGSRDEFHSHAFDSLNWVLKGKVVEQNLTGDVIEHGPGLRPIKTLKDTFHRVVSHGTTWVFSIRGPWTDSWYEFDPKSWSYSKLTHGRKVVDNWSRTQEG